MRYISYIAYYVNRSIYTTCEVLCLWPSIDCDIRLVMIEVRLKEMLESRGQSRYWLAKQTGIQYGTLMRIERADSSNRIELGTLDKLCAALNCQPGDLFVYVVSNSSSNNDVESKDAGKKAYAKTLVKPLSGLKSNPRRKTSEE
jgi:putative transcriptional regulator